MDILLYLTELIKTRKEVGIPGLGTIYKRKSPGRYDTETHSFLPPGYTLDFTPEVKEQEGLIDFISNKKNITTDSATYYVNQFAEDCKQELIEKQEISLGELGKLLSVSGELSFIPAKELNVGFDFYGLPSLKEPENIENEDTGNIEQPEITEEQLKLEDNNADLSDGSEDSPDVHNGEASKAESLVLTPPPPFADEYPNTEDPAELEEEDSKMPVYLKIIIVIAIALAAVAAAYFIKPDLFTGSRTDSMQTAAKKNESLKDSLAQADSLTKVNEKAILAIDSAKDSTMIQTTAVPDTAISFEIIAAALANQKEADDFLDRMKRRGIPAKVADMPGRKIKISIGTFTDEKTAKEALKNLKKTTRIPGIYIYTNRHTHK